MAASARLPAASPAPAMTSPRARSLRAPVMSQRPRRISMAAIALAPAFAIVVVAYVGDDDLDAADFLHRVQVAPGQRLCRLRAISPPVPVDALDHLVAESRDLRRRCSSASASSSASSSPSRSTRRCASRTRFRTIFLYPYAMSFIVTGPDLAMADESAASAFRRRCATSAGRASPSTGPSNNGMAIYALVHRRDLAGLGPRHGADARRAARRRRRTVEGGAGRRDPGLARLCLDRPAPAPADDRHRRRAARRSR